VTDNSRSSFNYHLPLLTAALVIATSGPSSAWPKKAYRNPTDQLVKFLDYKHGSDWSIFEFRAEGTGYPDSEVYHRIHHFPWPDHHPPPFAIIPDLMAAMRNWIQRTDDGIGGKKPKRVAVLHCKAGKGRSGTTACSYLISEEGWSQAEAIRRFTERRMRVGFGAGVSIPSQVRWISYVDRWTNNMSKKYVERPVEIVELHVWGLREGVKVAVEGYVEDGRRIETFHVFNRQEKTVMDEVKVNQQPPMTSSQPYKDRDKERLSNPAEQMSQSSTIFNVASAFTGTIQSVILKPFSPIILPSSDINIDIERRNQVSSYTNLAMVTSIAHVWFNVYFEGGHEGQDSGVFEIEWEAMDGIKGSLRKGTKALDKLHVVWRYATSDFAKDHLLAGMPLEKVISEPQAGEPVPKGKAADWGREDIEPDHELGPKKSNGVDSGKPDGAWLAAMQRPGTLGKKLGLRMNDPGSVDVSRASSVERSGEQSESDSVTKQYQEGEDEDYDGVRVYGPQGEEYVAADNNGVEKTAGEHPTIDEGIEGRQDTKAGKEIELGLAKVAEIVAKMKATQVIDGEHTGVNPIDDAKSDA
jgi:protein-tyrosine phosphatase